MDLQSFFQENPSAAIAFSGGTDSAFLLHQAKQYAREVVAFYVKSCFQPAFELEDAKQFCAEFDIELQVIPVDILKIPKVRGNDEKRCYYCKRGIFQAIAKAAAASGLPLLCDGTNASDQSADRPGMAALKELDVVSPLKICGLTKARIRQQSQQLGLFTAKKPAYACLATRIETDTPILEDVLERIEKSESFLSHLGFRDFRIRIFSDAACIQTVEEQTQLLFSRKSQILKGLMEYHTKILFDLEPRQPSDGLKLVTGSSPKAPLNNKNLRNEVESWNPELF